MNPFDKLNAQADIVDTNAWLQMQNQLARQPKKAASSKKRGRGGTLTSLISEAGGAGGAAGGAAIGTLIAPGVGTVIGGALGGLLGGGGGRAIENKVRDDEVRLEDVLTEGAISGAFGGLGSIGQGFKAVKGLGAVDDLAKGTAATRDLGKIAKFGLRQESSASGIAPGLRVGGKDLTLSEADRLGRFTVENFKAGTPVMKLQQIEPAIQARSAELADILKNSSARLTPKQSTQLQTDMLKSVREQVPTLFTEEGAASRKLTQLVNRFGGSRSPLELDDARKVADSYINFGRASAKNPEFEQAARVIRDIADKQITSLVPEAKTAKVFISNALDASDAIRRAAKPPVSAAGGGIFGRIAESAPVEGARAFGGRGAFKTGQALTSTPGQITSRTLKGIPTRGIANNVLNPAVPEEDMMLEDTLLQEGPMGEEMIGVGEMAPASPYSLQNMLADVQRDPEHAEDYMSLYKQYESIFNPVTKAPSGETQKRMLTAESGLRSLGTLEDTLSRDPGAFGRQALPNPLGITARLTGTTDVRAATDNIVDVIARLRSGAAITDEEAARFARLLPQPGDSKESALFKLQNVRAELESFASAPSSSSSLEEVLFAGQGGY